VPISEMLPIIAQAAPFVSSPSLAWSLVKNSDNNKAVLTVHFSYDTV